MTMLPPRRAAWAALGLAALIPFHTPTRADDTAPVPPPTSAGEMREVVQLQTEQVDSQRAQLRRSEQILQRAEAALAAMSAEPTEREINEEMISDTVAQELTQKLTKLKDKLSTAMRLSRNPQDPAVKRLQDQIRTLQKELDDQRAILRERLKGSLPRTTGRDRTVSEKLDRLLNEVDDLKRAMRR